MKIYGMAVGLAALFAVTSASAAPLGAIYDTITGGQTGTDSGATTLQNNPSSGPLSDSFSVSGPTQLRSVTVRVFDATPTDGGSILVYLVPKDPGRNTPWTSPSNVTTSQILQGASLLGTIADSAMPSTLGGACSLLSTCDSLGDSIVNTKAYISTAGMYWITLVNSSMTSNGGNGIVSNAMWEFDAVNGGGLGTTGQYVDHANTTGGLAGGAVLTSNAAFEMTVTTPEPASLAILGAGLVGLGLRRRRAAKKVAE